jgi:hypothetical protein
MRRSAEPSDNEIEKRIASFLVVPFKRCATGIFRRRRSKRRIAKQDYRDHFQELGGQLSLARIRTPWIRGYSTPVTKSVVGPLRQMKAAFGLTANRLDDQFWRKADVSADRGTGTVAAGSQESSMGWSKTGGFPPILKLVPHRQQKWPLRSLDNFTAGVLRRPLPAPCKYACGRCC